MACENGAAVDLSKAPFNGKQGTYTLQVRSGAQTTWGQRCTLLGSRRERERDLHCMHVPHAVLYPGYG
jgi:hypothetical protein